MLKFIKQMDTDVQNGGSLERTLKNHNITGKP